MNQFTRRKFIGQLAGAAFATSLPRVMRAKGASAGTRKPNVLFLMADDTRAELGCYASRLGAQTPHLDALAKAGVRFDRNYCQFPLCNPSRSSLLTGRYPTETGVLGNRAGFRTAHPGWISLPQLFKEAGYVSAATGKILHAGYDDPKAWTFGGSATVEDRSDGCGRTLVFERAEGPPRPPGNLPPLPEDTRQAPVSDRVIALDGNGESHVDYQTATEAISFLGRLKDEPFFLACGLRKPHSPICAPQKFFDLYDVNKIELPPDFAPWPTVPPGFPSAAIRKLNADLFIGRPAGVAEAREVIRAYLAAISWTDWNLGRVLAELDRLGLRENTIIVFVTDHGYQLGERGKWSKAGSLFEQGTRVPLIIAAPGAGGNGQSCARIVQSVDLYATLAELCGLTMPADMKTSVSLAPLIENPQSAWARPAYSVWSENGRTLHGVAVRTEKWRYAEFGPNGENGAMLFDSKNDPLELTNLAEDPRHAQTRAELSALTKKHAATLPKTAA